VAVGFDFDHTLGMDHKLERSAFVELMGWYAVLRGAAFDAAGADKIADENILRYRAGQCSLEQAFDAAFIAVQGQKPATDAIAQFKQLVIERAPEHVTALPGAPELLARLDAATIPYAILTNGWNPLQQCKAELIGFQKPVFVSDDLGVRKPNVHAFNVLIDEFGLPAAQVWYVGDDPNNDILGSLGAGMRAIWFDWEGKKYPTNVPAPTAIVTRLLDVLDLVL